MVKKVLALVAIASLVATLGGVTAAAAPTGERGPIKVLIGFKSPPGPQEHGAIQKLGGAVGRTYRTFPVIEATVPQQAIEALQRNPNVGFVEVEQTRTLGPLPETQAKGGQSQGNRQGNKAEILPWGVNRIDAEYAWAAGKVGAGVNVAFLDTGVDTTHPDLAGNIAGGFSAVSTDPTDVHDAYGHGTYVAGVIGAINNTTGVIGVGPQIRLWAVKVASGGILLTPDILEGIDWVNSTHGDGDPNNDIQVMNMSFGGGYSQAEDAALQTSYNLGILPVASAGNSGGAVGYPAALPQVVAVSATEKTDALASFSSRGPQVELAAPGVSVQTTKKGGGYTSVSGTSFSSPTVAGVAALVISAGLVSGTGQARTNSLRSRLQTTAQDLGANGRDNLYGYGLVDAEKAALGTTSGDNLTEPKPAP